MSDPPLLFVVGLQKSGTTLLLRLLTSMPAFRNPVKFEGKEVWGDEPPFTPKAYPVGVLYQKHGGDAGHELTAEDASDEIKAHLLKGFGQHPGKALVLKNPFNSGRVPWLRAMFPDAKVVVVVRRPPANVFSLYKKFTPSSYLKRGAQQGWWGLKPAGWRDLVEDDKVRQLARMWERVNGKLWAERDMIDRFIWYHDICADPTAVVTDLAALCGVPPPTQAMPTISPQDDEYLTGGSLESANRVYGRTKSFDLADAKRGEESLPALTDEQQASIEEICGPLAAKLGLDRTGDRSAS